MTTNPEVTEVPELEPGEKKSSTLYATLGAAIGLLGSEILSNGDRAALRRISPDMPYTPALWKILALLEQQGHEPTKSGPQSELSWSVLLSVAAHLVAPGQSLHDGKLPLGEALARAGWSRLRLDGLLRANDATLSVLLRRMARFLAAKQQPCNLAEVGQLLFVHDPDSADKIRLRIARSYFRTLYAVEKGEQS